MVFRRRTIQPCFPLFDIFHRVTVRPSLILLVVLFSHYTGRDLPEQFQCLLFERGIAFLLKPVGKGTLVSNPLNTRIGGC